MFTGIITTTARVKKNFKKNGSLFLTLQKPSGWKLKPGCSVAVNGVCLTARQVTGTAIALELMPETLAVTTFGRVVPAVVNLEQPLRLGATLDGHLVLGHADAVGKIILVKKQLRSLVVRVRYPKQFKKLIVHKGSVAVDGVSLTVSAAGPGWFEATLVDFTLKNTAFGSKEVGEFVNIEFDIIGKYLAQYAKR